MVQWSNANEKARWQQKIQFYRVRRDKIVRVLALFSRSPYNRDKFS